MASREGPIRPLRLHRQCNSLRNSGLRCFHHNDTGGDCGEASRAGLHGGRDVVTPPRLQSALRALEAWQGRTAAPNFGPAFKQFLTDLKTFSNTLPYAAGINRARAWLDLIKRMSMR